MFLVFFFFNRKLRKFLGGLCDWYQEEMKLRNGIEYKLGPCFNECPSHKPVHWWSFRKDMKNR